MTNADAIIERLGDTQVRVLKELAIYKYLTPSQMVKLGIYSDTGNLNKILKDMRERGRPFIKHLGPKMEYDTSLKKVIGRMEDTYFLSPRGAALVEEMERDVEEIKYLKASKTSYSQDAKHERAVIDCEIALRSTGANVLFFDRYFDHVGAQRLEEKLTCRTKVIYGDDGKHLKADAIFMIETTDKYLYCLEVHKGKDTGRAITQMKPYTYMVHSGVLSDRYELKRDSRLLWVFETEEMMWNTIKRAQEETIFDDYRKHFRCKSLGNIDPFIHNWRDLNGDLVTLF